MTEEERLAKNAQIRDKGRQTREKTQKSGLSSVLCENRHLSPSVSHELQYLASQMKQAVVQGIKHSLKALAALKTRNHKVGSLRYKSDYVAINLDMGIKTSVTTSYGRKYHVLVEESERIKKCQRLIARRKKGSSRIFLRTGTKP